MKNQQPPKLARKLFEWYCGTAKIEDLVGDMDEWFYKTQEAHSPFKAKLKYWKQVLSLMCSYAIRKRKKQSQLSPFSQTTFSFAILKNYLIVSARSLYRYKYFSIVNMIGLSLGMSISLLIITMFVYISTYDNFQANRDKIYRVTCVHERAGQKYKLASSPARLADKLKNNLPGIRSITRIATNFRSEAILNNNSIPISAFYVDPEFLSIFTFDLLEGNALEALQRPNCIVLTQSSAKKIFGQEHVLGQSFEMAGLGNFEVTGILKDTPRNTHLAFESLVSFSSYPALASDDVIKFPHAFNYGMEFVYLLVQDDDQLQRIDDYLKTISKQVSDVSDAKVEFSLQALTNINPGPDVQMLTGGMREWDYTGFLIFGTICFLILIPACFNYTNISIARAIKRAKEIGLRKTMGGISKQIFMQFIMETILVTTVSLLLAILIFLLIRHEFQSMITFGDSLELNITLQIAFWFLLFAIGTGFIAGLVPALYFSKLNPIQSLKNLSATKGLSRMWIRKSLTVFQFILSFGFIVALIVFTRQYRYSMNYDFGFHRENILDINLHGTDPNLFLSEYAKLSTVHNMSFSDKIMGLYPIGDNSFMQTAGKPDSLRVDEMYIDSHYIENLGLEFIAGKNFPNEPWTHEQYLIVNESFLTKFSIPSPSDALGEVVRVGKQDLEIIGVVKDFNYATLNWPIQSFTFRMDPSRYQYANLNVSFNDAYAGIAEMETIWKKKMGNPKKFDARFLRDEINGAFHNYTTLLKLAGFLGLLAISISLLGMLGMVVYTSESRTKEVGIRKVMGASLGSITFLLSKDYLKLMSWAILIATPLAVFILDLMLSKMQYYSVRLNAWDIVLGIIALLSLGILTISSQTIKTASTNPAETLRSE